MARLRIKSRKELTHEEDSMHLWFYPLILVPMGLYIIWEGIDQGNVLYLVTGIVMTVSPFLIILTTSPKSSVVRDTNQRR